MRRKTVGQAQRGRHLGAAERRSEHPQRNLRAFTGYRQNPIADRGGIWRQPERRGLRSSKTKIVNRAWLEILH